MHSSSLEVQVIGDRRNPSCEPNRRFRMSILSHVRQKPRPNTPQIQIKCSEGLRLVADLVWVFRTCELWTVSGHKVNTDKRVHVLVLMFIPVFTCTCDQGSQPAHRHNIELFPSVNWKRRFSRWIMMTQLTTRKQIDRINTFFCQIRWLKYRVRQTFRLHFLYNFPTNATLFFSFIFAHWRDSWWDRSYPLFKIWEWATSLYVGSPHKWKKNSETHIPDSKSRGVI